MSEQIPLGKLIDSEEAERDAVHIAIAPVVADEILAPGQDVGIVGGTENHVSARSQPHIGIIDPFLTHKACKGDRCYVCLYPNTVTGMRHHWAHKSFPPVAVSAKDKTAAQHYSEKWLRGFAESYRVEFDDLIEHAEAWEKSGEYWVDGGRFEGMGLYGDDQDTPFWDHYQTYTGKVVERRGNFFSCSC